MKLAGYGNERSLSLSHPVPLAAHTHTSIQSHAGKHPHTHCVSACTFTCTPCNHICQQLSVVFSKGLWHTGIFAGHLDRNYKSAVCATVCFSFLHSVVIFLALLLYVTDNINVHLRRHKVRRYACKEREVYLYIQNSLKRDIL